MKKVNNYLLIAFAITALLTSCAQDIQDPNGLQEMTEETVVEPVGRPVTISAGLLPETKISHDYEITGTTGKIKLNWEEGDQIKVSFNDIVETFTLKTGVGSPNATFFNANSQLEDDTVFSVDYVDKNNTDGWAIQKGSLDKLPEVLSAENLTLASGTATLTPSLTYFHVVATIPSDCRIACLSKLEGGFSIYAKPGEKGAITVQPDGGFKAGQVDFYIAAKLDGSTNTNGTNDFGESLAPKFQIAFGNDIQGKSPDGQAFDLGECIKYSWTPTKAYEVGKVYKPNCSGEGKFKTVSAAQAMPR